MRPIEQIPTDELKIRIDRYNLIPSLKIFRDTSPQYKEMLDELKRRQNE